MLWLLTPTNLLQCHLTKSPLVYTFLTGNRKEPCLLPMLYT